MDEDTFSDSVRNIVIAIISTLMIVFTSMFSDYIKGGVKYIVEKFNKSSGDHGTEENSIEPLVLNGIIPENGVYYTGGTHYEAGQPFPEIVTGDLFEYGDYIYLYLSANNGWRVSVLDQSLSNYEQICSKINNKNVVSMLNTFRDCMSITTAPAIPESITNMENAFYSCASLTEAPVIPRGITNMNSAFAYCDSLITAPTIPSSVTHMNLIFLGCSSLEGSVKVNTNPTEYTWCLVGTKITSITGSTVMKTEILSEK